MIKIKKQRIVTMGVALSAVAATGHLMQRDNSGGSTVNSGVVSASALSASAAPAIDVPSPTAGATLNCDSF